MYIYTHILHTHRHIHTYIHTHMHTYVCIRTYSIWRWIAHLRVRQVERRAPREEWGLTAHHVRDLLACHDPHTGVVGTAQRKDLRHGRVDAVPRKVLARHAEGLVLEQGAVGGHRQSGCGVLCLDLVSAPLHVQTVLGHHFGILPLLPLTRLVARRHVVW